MLNRISKKNPSTTSRYHKTKNVFDFGSTGIDDKVIATKKAIVEVNNGSYKLPETNSKVIFNETKGKILAVLGSEYKLVTHLQSLNEFYTKGEFQKLLEKHPNYECEYWNTGTAGTADNIGYSPVIKMNIACDQGATSQNNQGDNDRAWQIGLKHSKKYWKTKNILGGTTQGILKI